MAITKNNDLEDIWIGISDKQTEGTWRDVDGNVVPYSNWASGQPNGGSSDNCVIMKVDGLWDDVACVESHPFLLTAEPSTYLLCLEKFTISSTIILHTETVYMTLKKCHFVTQ